ncbi:Dynein beta chain [Blattella germanica]|nr:Dynein beta chain [Blattella germanica]
MEPVQIFNAWFQVDLRPFRQALLNTVRKWGNMFKQHLVDHELPEQWNNTKKIALTVKQQVAPLQATEVACIRNRIANFDTHQNQYRDGFRKLEFLRFDCQYPYDLVDDTHLVIAEHESEMDSIQDSASLFEVNRIVVQKTLYDLQV